jgi:hypothetical protein
MEMSRGGRRFGRFHATVETCHSFSSWSYWQEAQSGERADDLDASWKYDDDALALTTTRNGETWTQRIRFDQTRCNYGGMRDWFLCPVCARRVGKVYLPTCIVDSRRLPVNRWACRSCYSLTYEQRANHDQYWTLLHRAERLEARWFDGQEVIEGKSYIKPRKGLHMKTFERRVEQYNAMVRSADSFAIKSMGQLLGKRWAQLDADRARMR